LPNSIDDWVYPESRLVKGLSPYAIYIPNKEIMLKMMRACIQVKSPEDLWFNTDADVSKHDEFDIQDASQINETIQPTETFRPRGIDWDELASKLPTSSTDPD
jgi:hypothetical protein